MFRFRSLILVLLFCLVSCVSNDFDKDKYYKIVEYNDDNKPIAIYYGFGKSMKFNEVDQKLRFVDKDGIKRTIFNSVSWEIYE